MDDEIFIDSNESEGAFDDFVEEHIQDMVDTIINEGDLDRLGGKESDIIVELDDINPPTFVYDSEGGEGQGGGKQGPGTDKEKLRFTLPFRDFMSLIGEKLGLPSLTKEGKGKIKQMSYQFKTFGPIGIILDKKRTFRRALRSSIGADIYKPQQNIFDIQIRRNDRRYELPQRVEIPKYKAVVFYMGDISYSTYGERLELEKRIINFVQNWIDYNYGIGNVEHRFFVHDVTAYEVLPEDFYRVTNAGGTLAAPVFNLVNQIAFNEYDTATTNFYAFYFGDGEIFEEDVKDITAIIKDQMRSVFNLIGIVEVKPSRFSILNRMITSYFSSDTVIRFSKLEDKKQTIDVIKKLFGTVHA